MKYNFINILFPSLKLPAAADMALEICILLVIVGLVATLVTLVIRKTLIAAITAWLQGNKHAWDDPLAANKLLIRLSWFIPLSIFSLATDSFLIPETTFYLIAKRFITSGFVVVVMVSCSSLFATINDIHRIVRKRQGTSLRGYTDAAKIVTYGVGAIFLISIFTGKSPWGIFSVLGGLTAVVLLVFKDVILGFVASVQLTSTDMIRIGDWVQMDQYGADGDVIDISIHSIRIQNWDKTITTIPPYALVSNGIKNWRGMSESGGRRIKRAINIDLHSIHFCDAEALAKLAKIDLIGEYIKRKQEEIEKANSQRDNGGSPPVNGRQQTNIGIFRAYVIAYLRQNPHIHEQMTFLVRQLAPTDRGLPLEIYVFCREQAWADYEAIQADIFDHLLAAVPHFGLRVFQQPSGHDFQIFSGAGPAPDTTA